MQLIPHLMKGQHLRAGLCSFFPGASEPTVSDWGGLCESTWQDQRWFGRDASSEAWPEEKCSDFLKMPEDFVDRCGR